MLVNTPSTTAQNQTICYFFSILPQQISKQASKKKKAKATGKPLHRYEFCTVIHRVMHQPTVDRDITIHPLRHKHVAMPQKPSTPYAP